MICVTLGLGSNISHNGKSSVQLLGCACSALKEFISDFVFSSVYKTSPMYVAQQPDYYNIVVRGTVHDSVTPHALLKKINKIEKLYGRNRELEVRFGARSLDIDIELFGNKTVNTDTLTIPHPRMNERAFVLVPLVEILKDCADDMIREKYVVRLNEIGRQGVELYMSANDFSMYIEAQYDRRDTRRGI